MQCLPCPGAWSRAPINSQGKHEDSPNLGDKSRQSSKLCGKKKKKRREREIEREDRGPEWQFLKATKALSGMAIPSISVNLWLCLNCEHLCSVSKP